MSASYRTLSGQEIADFLGRDGTDARLVQLYELLHRSDVHNATTKLELLLTTSGDAYFRGVVEQKPHRAEARKYFPKEIPLDRDLPRPWMTSEFTYVFNGCIPDFVREFDDGIAQFAGFGEPWTSKPGFGRALYGHVQSRRQTQPKEEPH